MAYKFTSSHARIAGTRAQWEEFPMPVSPLQTPQSDGAIARSAQDPQQEELVDKLKEKLNLITKVVLALNDYALRYVDFFERGFSQSSPYLDRSIDYPPQYVDGVIWERLGQDLNVLTSARAQRYPFLPKDTERSLEATPDAPDSFITENIPDTLVMADRFADHILEMAAQAKLIDHAQGVTYFESDLVSRVIPYYPVALLGMPFSATTRSQPGADIFLDDILAIPHEIGHYVYWNARNIDTEKIQNMRLHEALQVEPEIAQKDPWILAWLEEIFADTFACATAGAPAVLNFQNYLLRGSRHDYVRDNGHHPPPKLRGLMQCRILELLGLEHAGAALKSIWQDKMDDVATSNTFHPYGHPEISCDIECVLADIDDVVRILLDSKRQYIGKYPEKVKDFPLTGELVANVIVDGLLMGDETDKLLDCEEITTGETIQDAIQARWECYRRQGFRIPPKITETSADTGTAVGSGDEDDDVASEPTNSEPTPGPKPAARWIDDVIKRYLEADQSAIPASLPATVWMAILHAGGWVTGPAPGSAHIGGG